MPTHCKERWEGPTRDLRLPLAAWNGLHNEGITTLDQLTAARDRLERLPGIALTMARVIREEARASATE